MTEVFKTGSCRRCVLFPLKNVSIIAFSRLTETETEGGLWEPFLCEGGGVIGGEE